MLKSFRKFGRGSAIQRLGRGLITGTADDDPSGIATYSQVGPFGFSMLWAVVSTLPLMVAIEIVSARMDASLVKVWLSTSRPVSLAGCCYVWWACF